MTTPSSMSPIPWTAELEGDENMIGTDDGRTLQSVPQGVCEGASSMAAPTSFQQVEVCLCAANQVLGNVHQLSSLDVSQANPDTLQKIHFLEEMILAEMTRLATLLVLDAAAPQ